MNVGVVRSNPYFAIENTGYNNNVKFQNDAKMENICVTLNISKEGRALLKNGTAQDMSGSFEDIQRQRKYLGNVVLDGGRFTAKLNDLGIGCTCVEEDWVACCADTYKTLYDEIISGYANGTREKYVSDENSKDGVRKLTMAEELQMLDDEYDAICDRLDYFSKRSEWENKALIKFADMLDKIRKDKSRSMYRAMVSSYEDFKSKQIKGGVRNAMMNAVAPLRRSSINVVV